MVFLGNYHLNELTLHNALHHPPPPIHSPSTTDQPSPTPTNTLDIGTSIFYADSENGLHNLWHLSIPFILRNTDHHPPDFRNTWHRHLKHRNHSDFLRLQAHTIQAITNACALSIDSTPFWWLLFHLVDMLVLAPSTATEHSHKSTHATIQDHINSIYSGDIEYVRLATTKPPNALLTRINSALLSHKQPPPTLLPPSTTPTSTLSTNSTKTSTTRHPHHHPSPNRQPCGPHLPRKVRPSHAPLQLCHWNPKWHKPCHQHNATTSGKINLPPPIDRHPTFLRICLL